MASGPLTFTLTPGMAPAAPLMRLLAQFDREKVEAFAEISIAFLDLIDPDPDAEDDDPTEANGDEQDGMDGAEDEFMRHGVYTDHGTGCPLADPGGCEHDGREPEDGY